MKYSPGLFVAFVSHIHLFLCLRLERFAFQHASYEDDIFTVDEHAVHLVARDKNCQCKVKIVAKLILGLHD